MDWDGVPLAGFVIIYALIAAVVPVWVLLAPRGYISTFLKIAVVVMLAAAILIMRPEIKMPADHAVRRRHRPDLRGQGVPVRVHHHRLRRPLRLPRAGVERHHAEARVERGRHPPRRLRQHGGGILRRHHGGHRRDAARSGRVLRHQHRRRHRRRHRRGRRRDDLRLGLPGHGRADARARGRGRRELAASPAPVARRRSRWAWPASSAPRSARAR